MRSLSVLLCSTLAATALAQSPLTTFATTNNQGNAGGGLYFDLQVNSTVTINRIDSFSGLNASIAGTGTLEVWIGPTTYVGNVTNPALWALVGSGTGTIVPGGLCTFNLASPFALGPGNYGVALKSQTGQFSFGYSNGNGTATPGSGTNQTYSTAELTLRGGAAQNAFLTGGIFSPRVFAGAIHYTNGGTPIAVAAWEPYGQGCYATYHTFYELFPSTVGHDLGNQGTTKISLTFIGTGYIVSPLQQNATWFSPPGTSTNLLTANGASTVQTTPFPILYPTPSGLQTTTQLTINDDGCAWPNGMSTSGAVPNVAQFMSGNARWGNWHDFDPPNATAVGAGVFFNVDPNGQVCYVTWSLMPEVGIVGGQTSFQLAFFQNGDVEFRWQTVSLLGGGGWPTIVGWTPGGNVLDPDTRDLSMVTVPFTTGPTDNRPLQFGLSARPQLGTTPSLVTDNIPAGTVIGAFLLGFSQINPGLDLAGIGAPGCSQYLQLAGAVTNVFFVPTSAVSVSVPFAMPNNPSLNGTLVFGQSATFSSGFNALGVITSNGVRLQLGSL